MRLWSTLGIESATLTGRGPDRAESYHGGIYGHAILHDNFQDDFPFGGKGLPMGSGGDTVGHGFHLGGSGKEVRYSSGPTDQSTPPLRVFESLGGKCASSRSRTRPLPHSGREHYPVNTRRARRARDAGSLRSVPKRQRPNRPPADTSKYCWKAPPAESSPVLEHYPSSGTWIE